MVMLQERLASNRFNRDFAGAADCAYAATVGDTFADPVFGNLQKQYVDPRIGYATLQYPNWRRNIPNAKLATRLLSGYVLSCRQRFRGIPLFGELQAQERMISAMRLPSPGTPNIRVFTHGVAEQLESDEEWLMAKRQQGFKVSHTHTFIANHLATLLTMPRDQLQQMQASFDRLEIQIANGIIVLIHGVDQHFDQALISISPAGPAQILKKAPAVNFVRECIRSAIAHRPALQSGDFVVVRGLTSARGAALNGCLAVVQGYDTTRGRYHIEVQGGQCPAAVYLKPYCILMKRPRSSDEETLLVHDSLVDLLDRLFAAGGLAQLRHPGVHSRAAENRWPTQLFAVSSAVSSTPAVDLVGMNDWMDIVAQPYTTQHVFALDQLIRHAVDLDLAPREMPWVTTGGICLPSVPPFPAAQSFAGSELCGLLKRLLVALQQS